MERFVRRSAKFLACLGALGLIFAGLLTGLSILLRLIRRMIDALLGTAFAAEHAPWIGSILGEEELVSLGVGAALFAALPLVTLERKHLRINLLKPIFHKKVNALLDLLSDLAFAFIAYLILTRQWFLLYKKPGRDLEHGAFEHLFRGDVDAFLDGLWLEPESQIIGFPLWPTYLVAEVAVFLFFLCACLCVVQSATNFLIQRKDP